MPLTQSPHCYRESLPPDTIRLLRLLPNEHDTAPIQCELFHYALQDSRRRTHPYEALSYVWGGPKKPQSIFIRDRNSENEHGCTKQHELPVTENLHAALCRFRYPIFERIIWIDAVCINQNDDREKEQQIQFMAKIYAQASRVLVWLGEAADDSDQALNWLRIAGGKMSKAHSSGEEVQRAVIALLQRPWFRRIWVLQEAAAARHILITSGPSEIDGYAFCLGVDSFEGFSDPGVNFQSLVRSVTYLIRGAIFRPDFSMRSSNRSSLNICPLGELVDMYRGHEATKRHDKVFALLGMCSDDLSKSNILPDYRVPWDELLQRLTKYLLSERISVETLDNDKATVVIKSKGCMLGKVVIQSDGVQADPESVKVRLESRHGKTLLTLRGSADSIQDGDIVCLLQGASRPTILRERQDYFDVVRIATTPPEEVPTPTIGDMEWVEFLQSETPCIHELILVWDWETSLKNDRYLKGYEDFLQLNNRTLECSTELEGFLNKMMRIWNVALLLGDLGEYDEAKKKFQTAIKCCMTPFGLQPPYLLGWERGLTLLSWAAWNGYQTLVHQLLMKDDVDPDLSDSTHSRTPLSWAAEGGHEAVVKMLLDTGKVEADSRDCKGRTPLSWAAEKGHEHVVKLLLETRQIEVDSKDERHGQTPLAWAADKGHEAVVKLLLETGMVEVDAKDKYGCTPLAWAARRGHEAVTKLLLETGKVDVNSTDDYGGTPLQLAGNNGHEAIVKLLLETGKIEASPGDQYGCTLAMATGWGGHDAIVNLLIESGEGQDGCKYNLSYSRPFRPQSPDQMSRRSG